MIYTEHSSLSYIFGPLRDIKNNQNIVLLSIEEYNSLIETNYLLSNTANSKRLLKSLEKARHGKSWTGRGATGFEGPRPRRGDRSPT